MVQQEWLQTLSSLSQNVSTLGQFFSIYAGYDISKRPMSIFSFGKPINFKTVQTSTGQQTSKHWLFVQDET